MSMCLQCKSSVLNPAAEPTDTPPSRPSRSSRPIQQPAVTVPPLPLKDRSKRPAPASTISSSARLSKQTEPASRAQPPASKTQKLPPSIPSRAPSTRPHHPTPAPVSTFGHQSKKSAVYLPIGPGKAPAEESPGQPTIASNTLSTLPLSRVTASKEHQHSGELVQLHLQQYQKSGSRNLGGMTARPPRHDEWLRTSDIMFEEIPSGRHWREKVMIMNSSVMAAVTTDIPPGSHGDSSSPGDVEQGELVRIVQRFAERQSVGRVNFENFILVCLCVVLLSQGVSKDILVKTLQICISDTSRQNMNQYFRGATFVNKLMNELFLTDWGYRAVDLIAICKPWRELC